MAVQNDSLYKAYLVATAVTIYRFVKLDSSGNLVPVAAVSDIPIGVAQESCAAGEHCTVRLLGGGIFKIEAQAAITTNSPCYMEADGRIDDTDPGSGVLWARAWQAATAAGDIIECTIMKL